MLGSIVQYLIDSVAAVWPEHTGLSPKTALNFLRIESDFEIVVAGNEIVLVVGHHIAILKFLSWGIYFLCHAVENEPNILVCGRLSFFLYQPTLRIHSHNRLAMF